MKLSKPKFNLGKKKRGIIGSQIWRFQALDYKKMTTKHGGAWIEF